jgi:hypothetical protein
MKIVYGVEPNQEKMSKEQGEENFCALNDTEANAIKGPYDTCAKDCGNH